jgi:transcriptional regulator with PAS, ATPase and Fis domain
LDEIGDMPLETQAKLLRVLEEGKVYRVGGKDPVESNARIITATNLNLSLAIEQGRFRSDLFYRLSVFPLNIPPLRQRPEDIPILAQYFVDKYRVLLNKPCNRIEPISLERLVRYPWPGNVVSLKMS